MRRSPRRRTHRRTRRSRRRYSKVRRDPKKIWVKVDWILRNNPLGIKGNPLTLKRRDILHLEIPTTRYSETTDDLMIPTSNGRVTLDRLLKFIYDYYQQPIGSEMLKKLREQDIDDTFGYIKNARENTKRIDLLGDMIFFEGINFEKRIGNQVYYILSLGS